MSLPKLEDIQVEEDGTLALTENQYLLLSEEASIAMAESGADREFDCDTEDFTNKWITAYLGTQEWYSESPEPADDGYDYGKYH